MINDNNFDMINVEYDKILLEFNNFIRKHLLPIINKYHEPLENNIFYNDYENNDIKKSMIFLGKLTSTKNVLDIGFHSGFSTLLFLLSNPNIIITAVDIVKYPYVIPCYLKIKEHFNNRINLIWGNSIEELKNIKNINNGKNNFDIVNIDGSIYNKIVIQDIQNSMLLANNDSYFILKKNINILLSDNSVLNNFTEIIKNNDENIFIYKHTRSWEESLISESSGIMGNRGSYDSIANNKSLLNNKNIIKNPTILQRTSLKVNPLDLEPLRKKNEKIIPNEEIIPNEKKLENNTNRTIPFLNNNLPIGSWINSAKNYYVQNEYLYAELKSSDDSWIFNKIKFSNIAYENNNGQLEPINIYIYLENNNLSTCLKIISSLFIIAKYYGYGIYIDYNSFDNLDNNNNKIILYYLFYKYCKKSCSNKYEKLNYQDYVEIDYYISKNINYNINNNINNDNNFIKEVRFNYLPNNSFSIVKNTTNNYNIIPGNMTIENFMNEKINFYKALNYPSFLIDNINNFTTLINLSEYIGIYIEYIEYFENNDLLKIFADKIFELRKLDNKIIIFSNNSNIVEHFMEENYIIKPNKCSDSTYQILYEMILLSKTKLIITVNNQDFSQESAFFEGTGLEIYNDAKKEWILYSIPKNI